MTLSAQDTKLNWKAVRRVAEQHDCLPSPGCCGRWLVRVGRWVLAGHVLLIRCAAGAGHYTAEGGSVWHDGWQLRVVLCGMTGGSRGWLCVAWRVAAEGGSVWHDRWHQRMTLCGMTGGSWGWPSVAWQVAQCGMTGGSVWYDRWQQRVTLCGMTGGSVWHSRCSCGAVVS